MQLFIVICCIDWHLDAVIFQLRMEMDASVARFVNCVRPLLPTFLFTVYIIYEYVVCRESE